MVTEHYGVNTASFEVEIKSLLTMRLLYKDMSGIKPLNNV